MARGAKILLVDDEPLVRQMLRRVLEGAGYTVIEASSADDARRALHAAPRSFDLVLLDQTMPLESGTEAAPGLYALCPAPIVLFTGHALDPTPPIVAVLEKPAPVDELLGVVDRVLENGA